ncbi:MAG: hypothetical protein ABSG15_11245 [FCB group bacterium]
MVGKQRNGPTGTARLAFVKEFARFENLAFEYQDVPMDMDEKDDDVPPF